MIWEMKEVSNAVPWSLHEKKSSLRKWRFPINKIILVGWFFNQFSNYRKIKFLNRLILTDLIAGIHLLDANKTYSITDQKQVRKIIWFGLIFFMA